MSEATPAPTATTEAARGSGERGRGFGRGDRGRGGRGGRGGGRPGGRGAFGKEEWTPLTKLGRLVKAGYINQLEEIYTHSIPIKEAQIVDTLIKKTNDKSGTPVELSDEVMCILSVQKQTKAGQRTRFKAVVAVGDRQGHCGLGIKVAKEVQIAIKGALVDAKMNLIPVRRGYWGSKIGDVHTIPVKVKGKCGSCTVRLVPAPRGTGCVAAQVTKKILMFAGIDDVYTSCVGQTRTRENFCRALFYALKKTYSFLTPDLWPKTNITQSPFAKFSENLTALAEKKARGPRDGERGRGRGRGDGRGRGRGGDRGRGDRRGRGGDRGRGGN
jgi:small subunit ribosomal protein S2e